MSWVFDGPSGTYKNFALSTNIRREAIADAVFMKYLTSEPGYGKRRGESVTITRILRLPLATRVGENDALPSGRPPIESKQVKIAQWGFKVPVTEFERHLSHFDLMNEIQRTLREQITLTMDQMAAAAYKLTPTKFIPTAAGGVFDEDGTPSTVSDKNLAVADLRQIHDRLKGGLKTPAFRNGMYVGILSTRAARGIKNDPEYKDWLAPTDSSPLLTGRIKDVEGFMLIESNHTDALADLAGTSTTTGEAVFFGADGAGLIQVMAPELRAGLPTELGLHQDVGWVGTLEAFLVWEKASLSRVVHVASQ